MVIAYTAKLNYSQEFYDDTGNFVFVFNQNLRNEQVKVDNLDVEVVKLQINGYEAFLAIGNGGEMSIVWTDDYYSYMINGVFANQEQLIEIASSVKPLRFQS